MRIEVPAEAAGERLDVFLATHVGSRAAAQRAIDGGRVLVDGEERAKRYALHGGETVEVLDEPEVEEVEAPEATFEIAWEDEHLLRGRQAGGRGRAPGARAPRRARSPRRSSAAARPGARRAAPGSSTASTATPRGCSSSRAPRRSTRRSRRR